MKKFKKILQIIRFIAIFVIKKDTIIRSSITKKLTKLAAAAIHGRLLLIAAANAAPALIVLAVPNKKYKRSLNGYYGSIYLAFIKTLISCIVIIILPS